MKGSIDTSVKCLTASFEKNDESSTKKSTNNFRIGERPSEETHYCMHSSSIEDCSYTFYADFFQQKRRKCIKCIMSGWKECSTICQFLYNECK